MGESELIASVRENPVNRAILERMPEAGLTDAWLVSGAVFQTVWNALTGRPSRHGIKDYDIFYFDPDTSWEAEDAAIRRCDALFADLGAVIEVRNQARVHLWYTEKFGLPYPRLTRASEGIDQFLTGAATQVALTLDGEGYRIYAPGGLDDLVAMIVRPNPTPHFHAGRYREKTDRWRSHWPELTIVRDFAA
jgi:hypothetical protein